MKPIYTNKIIRNMSLVATCLSLSACFQSTAPQLGGAASNLPAYQQVNPIQVKKGKAEINLVLPKKSGGMSRSQTAISAQFILDYLNKGEGHFEIWRPRGHLNAKAVNAAHVKIRSILREVAIPATAISYHTYDAFGDERASLGLKYNRYFANTRQCGTSMANLGQNYKNENYKNFGCAYQHNIAKLVSNPRDLLGPETVTNASAERRQIIWAKYIQGVPTGAARSGEETISISEAAK